MTRLIGRTSAGEAFAFGWQAWPQLFREGWYYYVALIVGGAILSANAATRAHFHTTNIEYLAFFPAMAASSRFVIPTFRMRLIDVLAVLGLAIIAFCSFLIPTMISFRLAMIALPAGFLVALAGFGVGVWLFGKLSLAPTFYALSRDNGATLLGAIRESWTFAAGSTWWRFIGIIVAIFAASFIPMAIVLYLVLAAISASSGTAVSVGWLLPGALLASALLVVDIVWLQASFTAFATSSPGFTINAANERPQAPQE